MSGECDKSVKIPFRSRSFKDSIDTLVQGMIQAHKECPDAENKTFEEIAQWAGQNVLLTEGKDER